MSDEAFPAITIWQLRKALEALPPPQRTVFLMSARDGASYEEISKRLGIAMPEVVGHLAKAISILDAALLDLSDAKPRT